jgi:hypothetical protein
MSFPRYAAYKDSGVVGEGAARGTAIRSFRVSSSLLRVHRAAEFTHVLGVLDGAATVVPLQVRRENQ